MNPTTDYLLYVISSAVDAKKMAIKWADKSSSISNIFHKTALMKKRYYLLLKGYQALDTFSL